MGNAFGKILNISLTVIALAFAAYALKPLVSSYLPSMTSWGTPQPLLIASISLEHGKNELRAKEKFGKGTFDVTGFASDFEMDKLDGNVLNIIMGDGRSNIALYAKIPGGRVGQVAQLSKGNLITVTCKDYGIYGATPSFSECKDARLHPLNGKSAELVYDQLLAASNPYLNPSPTTKGKADDVKQSAASTAQAHATDGSEIIVIDEVAPNRDFSVSVIASRLDSAKTVVTLAISAETSADVHDLISKSRGKKVRVKTEPCWQGQTCIVKAELAQ